MRQIVANLVSNALKYSAPTTQIQLTLTFEGGQATCRVADQDMLAEYTARNNVALEQLVNEHGVQLRQFPDDVLRRLRELSEEVVAEVGARDEISQRIYASYTAFLAQVRRYHDITENAYYRSRDL